MHQVVSTFRAPGNQSLNVWIEPWAEGLTLSPGTLIELHAAAPCEGNLIIDRQKNGVAVYAWPGSTLRIYTSGLLIRDFSTPAPGVPDNMNMQQFMTMLFGTPPTETT